VRATNSGISAFISPTGEVLAQLEDNQRARMTVSAPRMVRIPTLMVAWGDWLGLPALLVGVGLVLVPALASRRRSVQAPLPDAQASGTR
jgi:apolipoprotein N-acyltransferase